MAKRRGGDSGSDGDPLAGYLGRLRDNAREIGQELLAENTRLRDLVGRVERERDSLACELRRLQAELDRHQKEMGGMLQQLSEIQAHNQRYSEQFARLEQQNHELMNLYVASFRLHSVLDRRELMLAIQEIIANLVGSEELAVYGVDEQTRTLRLLHSFGLEGRSRERIDVGEGVIGRAVSEGSLFVRGAQPPEGAVGGETGLTACIPLKVGDRAIGALAVYRLLEQKAELSPVDHEIFQLLGTQAAMALYCTELHARSGALAPAGAL